MLLQLNISNFALIENLTINFEKGFNVLTGETGAGKSILIDAISYVLGGKFSKDLIRTGEEKTYVEAVFTIENKKTAEVLKLYDIEAEDMVIISRETFMTGKSIAKINGKAMLLNNVKTVSSTLLDIHGQHENQNLLDSANHIYYVDDFGGEKLDTLLENYRLKYRHLLNIDNEINKIQGKAGEKETLIDFYKYQLDEINKAKLRVNEDVELESEFSILSNAEKINNSLNICYEILDKGGDSSPSVYDALGLVIKEIRGIQKHIEKVKAIGDSLEESYYNLEQNIAEVRNLRDSIQYDENKLEFINSRIYQIGLLKKKYGNSIKEIIEFRDKIQTQYEELINSNEIIEKLKKEKAELIIELTQITNQIHDKRCKTSILLEKEVTKELKYIGLEKCIFKIEISKQDGFNENGNDKVQFLISTNPGEPLKDLEKIVSGGELSRIMLAFKTVFVDKDSIPSVIFDEIDVGISGRVAQSVAEKMYLIATKHQVFCVTHLSQIACMSDTHFLISKDVKKDKTYTSVTKLSNDHKQIEIARMVGGAEVTKLTMEHAKELIFMAEIKKNELI